MTANMASIFVMPLTIYRSSDSRSRFCHTYTHTVGLAYFNFYIWYAPPLMLRKLYFDRYCRSLSVIWQRSVIGIVR